MNTSEFTLTIVRIIFAIISLIITYYVLPFLNELTVRYKNTRLENFVKDSVQAAEQIIKGNSKGATKKKEVSAWVSKWIKEHYNMDISEDEISNMIESAVYTMNNTKESVK